MYPENRTFFHTIMVLRTSNLFVVKARGPVLSLHCGTIYELVNELFEIKGLKNPLPHFRK